MTNAEVAAVFKDIAELLRLKKDNIFKIRAYEKAARAKQREEFRRRYATSK
jgi:DNA polymerase/3'-5' exonuclease PolX